MERKYANGFEIINTKGLKILANLDFYKIIIRRKEKAKKSDTYAKYLCSIYMKKEDEYGMSWVISEIALDKIMNELKND